MRGQLIWLSTNFFIKENKRDIINELTKCQNSDEGFDIFWKRSTPYTEYELARTWR
jgi:hypothetical protein